MDNAGDKENSKLFKMFCQFMHAHQQESQTKPSTSGDSTQRVSTHQLTQDGASNYSPDSDSESEESLSEGTEDHELENGSSPSAPEKSYLQIKDNEEENQHGKGACSSMDIDEKRTYTVDEFFTKNGRRNTRNPARKYLQYLIRKAAQEVGVWGKMKFSDLPPAKKCYIVHRVVSCTNEDMKKHEQQLDLEIKKMLVNAKAYSQRKGKPQAIRRRPSLQALHRRPPVPGAPPNHPRKKSTKRKNASEYELKVAGQRRTSQMVQNCLKNFSGDINSSSLIPGDTVFILGNEGTVLAEAIFLREKNDMFAELSFQRKISEMDKDLYEPVEASLELHRPQKLSFTELETDDIFVWKLDQVKKSYPLRKDRKQVQRYSQ